MSTEKVMQFMPHIETARKAVAAVEDLRLREIAFGCILNYLLTSDSDDSNKIVPAKTVKHADKKVTVRTASTGITAWLRELFDEGFFAEPRSMSQIIQELSNRSHHLKANDLTKQMELLCHGKSLRRRKQAYMSGGREVFHWSNW